MKLQKTITLLLSATTLILYCTIVFTLCQYENTPKQNRPLFEPQEAISILAGQNRVLRKQIAAISTERDRWKLIAQARKDQLDGLSMFMDATYFRWVEKEAVK